MNCFNFIGKGLFAQSKYYLYWLTSNREDGMLKGNFYGGGCQNLARQKARTKDALGRCLGKALRILQRIACVRFIVRHLRKVPGETPERFDCQR